MKKTIFLLLILTSIVACKTKKNMIDANVIATETSEKKVAKKHAATFFNKKSLDAKYKVNYDDGKINQSISVQLKIVKDEVIWLKGTKIISVFKAKITKDSVSYYSPLARHYFKGDFSLIKDLLGVEINFEQLQNLFLGQAIQDLKATKNDMVIKNNTYVLSSLEQTSLYNLFFTINPAHFKLDNQFVIDAVKNQRFEVSYPTYQVFKNELIPTSIKILSKSPKNITQIDLDLRDITFDEKLDVSFSIPNGYKQLELK